MKQIEHLISFITVILCITAMLLLGTKYYPKYEQAATEATISWDVAGYYAYLPALYIHDDIKQLGWMDSTRQKYIFSPYLDQYFKDKSGSNVLKYSIGMSVLYTPAFAIAHVCAPMLGYPQDGYSKPYQIALTYWSFLITFIGLFVLRSVLLNFFSDGTTAITIAILVFCTNYLEYGSITNAMSHNYLFTGYAILLLLCIKFYNQPRYRYTIGMGVTIGLMALARPTEIISLILPLCWTLSWKRHHFRAKLNQLIEHFNKYIVGCIIIAIIGSIQIIYWVYVTGRPLVYSYQEQGFSWLRPHLIDGIFSFRAGWLIYTPVMLLSLIGFHALYKKNIRLFTPIFIMSVVFIYIAFAWDIWWYGGSLGQRTMVQMYPVLAFPLAAFIEYISTKKILTFFMYVFIIISGYLNYWMTHQAHKGSLLYPGDMTKAYFLAILGKDQVDPSTIKLLDARMNYTGTIINDSILIENTKQFCLNNKKQYSQRWTLTPDDYKRYLRFSIQAYTPEKEAELWRYAQMIISYYKNGENTKNDFLRVQRLIGENEWQSIYLDSKINNGADKIEISIWNADSDRKICFRELKVITYDQKSK
jgi:hypothetical protein